MSQFDPSDEQFVLGEIGSGFAEAISGAVAFAKESYEGLRIREPRITRVFTERTSANVIHDLIWDDLARALSPESDYTLHDTYPLRYVSHVCGNRLYKIRLKRHRGDLVSSYPTETDKRFYAGRGETFDGFEVVSLAAGYRWDSELGEVVCPVISYREGKTNVIWSVEPSGVAQEATPVLRPGRAIPPAIDLFDAAKEAEEEKAEGDER